MRISDWSSDVCSSDLTLARAASSASGGLRIDDSMTLVDTMRLAWRLRSLDAESLVLPTQIGSNSSGSVLFLVEPDAEAVLAQLPCAFVLARPSGALRRCPWSRLRLPLHPRERKRDADGKRVFVRVET